MLRDYAWSVSDCTLCSASPAMQASMGDCGPWGGAGEELLGATLFGTAGRRPNPGMLAASRGGSCPTQRDQATSTADLPGRGPRAGFGSGEPEHASSRSKYPKAPLVEDSEGVAGLNLPLKWTGGASAVLGTITLTSDMAELTVSSLIVTAGHWVLIIIK